MGLAVSRRRSRHCAASRWRSGRALTSTWRGRRCIGRPAASLEWRRDSKFWTVCVSILQRRLGWSWRRIRAVRRRRKSRLRTTR